MKRFSYVFSAVFSMAMSGVALGEVIKNDNVDPVLVLKESKRPKFVLSASALFNVNAEKFGFEGAVGSKFNLIKGDSLSFFLSPEIMYRYIPMNLTHTDEGNYLLDEHYNKVKKTVITGDIKYIPALQLVDGKNMDTSSVIKNAVSSVINAKANETLLAVQELKSNTEAEISNLNKSIEILNNEVSDKEQKFNEKSEAYDAANSKYYADMEKQRQAETLMNGGTDIGLTNDVDKNNTKGLKDRLEDSKTAYNNAKTASEEAKADYNAKDEEYTNIARQRNTYTSNMIEAQKKVDELNNDISTLEGEIEALDNQIKELDIETLSTNYQELLNTEGTTDEAKNEALEALNKAYETKGSLDEQIEGKKGIIETKQEELTNQNNIVTENNRALLDSHEAFNQATKEKEEANDKKGEAETKEREAKEDMDGLQGTYDKVGEIIKNAGTVNEENEKAVNDAKAERDDAKQAFVDASRDRNGKQEQIKKTQAELINVLSTYNTSSLEDIEERIKEKIESSSEIYMKEYLAFSSSIQHMAFSSVRIGLTLNNKFSPYIRPMIGVLFTNNGVYGKREYILKIEGDDNHYRVGEKQFEESRKLASLGYGGGIGFDYHFTKNFFVNVEYSYVRSSFDVRFEKEKIERTMTHNLHFVKIGFGIEF